MKLPAMQLPAKVPLLLLAAAAVLPRPGLGASGDSGIYQNPRRSPNGAVNVYLTPFINSVESDEPIPGCGAVEFSADATLADLMQWPWSGVERFSRLARREIAAESITRADAADAQARREAASAAAAAEKFTTRPLTAAAEEASLEQKDEMGVAQNAVDLVAERAARRSGGGSRRSDPRWEAYESSFLPDLFEVGDLVRCAAAGVGGGSAPAVGAAVCTCIAGAGSAAQSCALRDAFALTAACVDRMAEGVNAERWCPLLLQESRGVSLPKRCAGSIVGDLEAIDMGLNQLNFPHATPAQVDPTTVREELRSYWAAYKAVQRLSGWADAHIFCNTDPDAQVATLTDFAPLGDGWESKQYFWMQGLNGRRIPFAVLAQRKAAENTVAAVDASLLLIRDVRTTFEGRLMFADEYSRALHPDDTVLVHGGADAVVQTMLPAVRNFLTKHLQKSTAAAPRILTVGYGQLGGSVAAIMALELARQLPAAAGASEHAQAVRHDAIIFAPGNVGDYNFVAELAEKVNLRTVTARAMGLAAFPCETQIACGGEYVIPTGTTGGTIGPYLPLRGVVNVPLEKLPHDAWRRADIGLFPTAHRTCAINCWLASEYCTDESRHQCTPHDCPALA